jgi:hypothetical protein
MLRRSLRRIGLSREPTPEELAELNETDERREFKRDLFVDSRIGTPSRSAPLEQRDRTHPEP